ncbi:MAG: LamG-like jellyroll fold domain-containing protein, partial [Planctomycetota bacterium]
NLAWTPGGFAVSHDVYFGTSLEDVNGGAEGTFVGNVADAVQIVGFPGFPIAEGLEPGTTYYWRVDEVNDAEPNSPWKGDVWSFTVPSKTAYGLDPTDGAKYVDADVTLSWAPGFAAKLHNVYFGDNFDDVNTAAGALPLADATYTPGTLELGKTYYWRVDEFDGAATHKGQVLSFQIKPDIPVTDPDLICWWQLDEGQGTTVLDWSGHGHDGTFSGEPQWVDGYDGGALKFDGVDDYVIHQLPQAQNFDNFTVALWARVDSLGQAQYMSPFSSHTPNSSGIQIDVDGTYPGNYRTNPPGGTTAARFGPAILGWVHLALVGQGTTVQYYYNGTLSTTETFTTDNLLFNEFIIGTSRNNVNHLDGAVDDLRVYTRALTQEEIQLVMRIDPLRAWNASPTNGSMPDIDAATPLSWSPGDNVSQHEVYFGIDRDAVENADTSDTTGVYHGNQAGTSFTPAEGVEWGGGPYYWRIDENNTDGTVTKGRVWSFTVADFILVDDFEDYTDNDMENEAIWQHWIDGFGIPTNGSQVGYLLPPYAEQTIVNSGGQSMPISYDNTAGVTYSQAELALTAPRDWTKHGVGVLSLWFRGYPPSVGSFIEGPVGTFTMTGSGADIWNTSDEFHFAYKTLTGPGTIVARVDSIENTHNWAKAGVMIRETLNADSKYSFALISAASGVAAQGRTDTGIGATGTTEAGVAAPHWVKLERDAAGFFTVSHSTNGSSWVPVAGALANNIPMVSTVYVGLAVTSHDATATCEAKFSNVTITGTANQQWMHQDIGILANNAEPLYVSLANAGGTPAVVVNEDANAAVTDVWTQWNIHLNKFSDQGINLADIDKIAVGLGARGGATAAGGSGTMFIDDIRLLRPAPQPEPEPQP